VISKTAEYALRAVCFLANGDSGAETTELIARATQVPPSYLTKVLQLLRKAGIVQTQRGTGGGISLAKPATNITILDVVNAVDPIQRIPTCPLGLAQHSAALCPMHSQLDDAFAQLEQVLQGTTIAELIARPRTAKRQCRFPEVVR
jgi:Rrf2 family nitric oxide-sensitive transcriptional repressor